MSIHSDISAKHIYIKKLRNHDSQLLCTCCYLHLCKVSVKMPVCQNGRVISLLCKGSWWKNQRQCWMWSLD